MKVDFWDVIGTNRLMDARDVEVAIHGVSGRLADVDLGGLGEFSDELAETLFAIDRRVLAEIPVRLAGLELPQSDDHFLYARCACVLSGREDYLKVLARDEEFERFNSPSVQSSEGLLYVAESLYESRAGRKWIRPWQLSVETGSNLRAWSE